MNSRRLYYILVATLALLVIGLIGGAYGADKLLVGQSRTLVHNRLRTAVLDAQQQQLSKAKQDIRKYHDLAVIAQSVVPQDKDQAQTVRQIVDLAKANGVALSSITFPASTLGTLPGAGANRNLSQLTPVKGITGVYDLQLTVQSDAAAPVPYSRFMSFLAALEHNRRTALISSITLQPDQKDRSTLSFTLVLDEYIKP